MLPLCEAGWGAAFGATCRIRDARGARRATRDTEVSAAPDNLVMSTSQRPHRIALRRESVRHWNSRICDLILRCDDSSAQNSQVKRLRVFERPVRSLSSLGEEGECVLLSHPSHLAVWPCQHSRPQPRSCGGPGIRPCRQRGLGDIDLSVVRVRCAPARVCPRSLLERQERSFQARPRKARMLQPRPRAGLSGLFKQDETRGPSVAPIVRPRLQLRVPARHDHRIRLLALDGAQVEWEGEA